MPGDRLTGRSPEAERASLLDRIRGVAHTTVRPVRALTSRLLHPGRHRRARERLSNIDRPRHILVVCHANICRSPYLEAELQRLLPDVVVASAGFVTAGRPMPDVGRNVAARRGLDMSGHRSRMLSREVLRVTDLVIVMDARQARHLVRVLGMRPERVILAGDLDAVPGETRAIRDPWGQPARVYTASFARLARSAKCLASLLPPASPATGRSDTGEPAPRIARPERSSH